jgi:hypothetical protein
MLNWFSTDSMQLSLTEVIALWTLSIFLSLSQMTFQRLDPSFSDLSLLQVEDVMELLNICLKTIHFHFEDEFDQ